MTITYFYMLTNHRGAATLSIESNYVNYILYTYVNYMYAFTLLNLKEDSYILPLYCYKNVKYIFLKIVLIYPVTKQYFMIFNKDVRVNVQCVT